MCTLNTRKLFASARSEHVSGRVASRPFSVTRSGAIFATGTRRSYTRCSSVRTERRLSTLINALYSAVRISGR